MPAPLRNWGTAVRELQLLCRRASNDTDAIKRALCEAIEYHEREHLWFKAGRFTVLMTAEKSRYRRGEGASSTTTGVPDDLESIPQDLQLWPSGNETARVPMRALARERIERAVTTDPTDEALVTGAPQSWGWYNDELLISPVPSSSTDVVAGPYERSLGTPYALYASSSWGFFKPSTQAMEDTYPNPAEGEKNAWFGEGYNLTKYRAAFVLQNSYLRDDREANACLVHWQEEVSRLQAQGTQRRMRREVQGYL